METSCFSTRGLVGALLLALSSVAQEISHSPESTTIFLNQSAVFTCMTRGGVTLWRVNGTQRELLLPILRDLVVSETTSEGVVMQTLTIPARAQYNGTRVQCVSAIVGVSLVESDNVTLTIQGQLSAVAGLSAVSNANSVIISWSAPFSLDVTGVDPDIWYSVLIYNVTDENNPTAILCTDCINITETHYTFTPDYLSPCHVYNLSVIPLNGAGQGESSPSITITIGKPTFIRTHIKALCDDDVAVTYEHREMVDEYILHGVSDMDLQNISLSSNHRVSTYTLSANKNFNIFFEVFTAAGPVNVSHVTFTTYDVQSLSVEEEEGGVLVRGEFMSGSRATGCLVVLQGPPSCPDIFRALPRSQSQDTVSTTVPVPPSTYTVYGYDLEENGLPNTMPAILLENQILINSDADKVKPSFYLKSASISQRGSTVVIDCEFSEVYPEASCVLVYREYGSPLLTVVDIPQLFDFPVSITVDSPENYTVALFGKNGATGLDEEPLVYTKFSGSATDETDRGKEEGNHNSQGPVVAISIGTVLVCVLVCGSAVVVLVMVRRYHNHSKSTHALDAGK
ncbi:hypothetical protein GBAR_LOCUS5345 [Geodia barretti]|uniref:Fibronectin type-III domain-containing protein n=1 Tax=Geodia barretti TaxID=519541 RepID=A0AA35RCL8_GEOBA|nr:hypothetical protein GBAR_LOCUS5345 [Geodia barretti]